MRPSASASSHRTPRLALSLLLSGMLCCKNSDTVTGPNTLSTSTSTSTPTPSPSVLSGNYKGQGTFTWQSIQTSRTLCPEITGQVGESWPLYVTLQITGSSVRLSMAEDPTEPEVFTGTVSGSAITASGNPAGGFACPQDATVTPQVSSALTATTSQAGISGQWTETYGSGADEIALYYHFEANLARQ